MNKRVKKILKNPANLFLTLGIRGFFNWMSDEEYIRIAYWCRMHKKLNLENPQTFNEKLQWLKLHDRKSEYTLMVDKYEAKRYVAERVGDGHVIPTIGVWDKFEDIDFKAMPNQFVLKCTHDSGSIVICRDKSSFNIEKAKGIINRGLKHNSYWAGREWPYRDVQPRIIAEKFMEDESGNELKDYKFFCFNGVVKCLKIDFNRFTKHRANYYDTSMELLPFGEAGYPPDYHHIINKTDQLAAMIAMAEKLSSGKPFLRVDLYNVNNTVYFGELTFYPAGGMGAFTSEEWDYKLGSWLELP